MSDFLARLLGRSRGTVLLVQPSLPARFEDVHARFGETNSAEEGKTGMSASLAMGLQDRTRTQEGERGTAKPPSISQFVSEPGSQKTSQPLNATPQGTTLPARAEEGEPSFPAAGRQTEQPGRAGHSVEPPLSKQRLRVEDHGAQASSVEMRDEGRWRQGVAIPSPAERTAFDQQADAAQGTGFAHPKRPAEPQGNAADAHQRQEATLLDARMPFRVEARRAAPESGTRLLPNRGDEERPQAAVEAVRPIEVHIGRIEIVAPPAAPVEKVLRVRVPQPALGLTEYLERRNRGAM